MYFLLKILISALVVAAVSEIGRRSTLTAALVASLPLNSVLALTWLYHDTRDGERVIALSRGIFWALLPSLFFLLLFPWLLRSGVRFGAAMGISLLAMGGAYLLYVGVLGRFGIRF